MDDLEKLLDKYAWSPLQIQQLRLAKKHGVTLQYFHPKYDWEQLKEIRLAIEDGLDPSFILDNHINSDSMKNAREQVYKISGLAVINNEKIKKLKLKRLIILSFFLIVLISLCIIFIWKKDYINSMLYDLELVLISDKKTIGISEIEKINYIDFIKDYSKNCELILPNKKIDKIGEYKLTFTIKNQTKKLSRYLILIVRDDIPPVINLQSTNISIDYNNSFDPRQNILSATDNVDGDITDMVEIKNNVDIKKSGQYKVEYTLSDSSGNKTSNELIVTVKNKENTTNNNNSNSIPNNNSTNSNTSSTSNNINSRVSVTAINKVFLFSDYGDASITQKEALEYGETALSSGNANKFECNPLKENGLYIGYEIKFY